MKRQVKLLLYFAWFCLCNENAFAQGIIIPSGTYIVGSTAFILDYSNFTNNASTAAFTHSGLFSFAGTTQSAGGSAVSKFLNVNVNSGSTTTFSGAGQQVSGILLCNGTVNAGGLLTLLANSSSTALIDGSGTGTVSGTTNVQAYLTSSYGYHYLSPPVTNATVAQLGSYTSLAFSGFPSVYSYTENKSSAGWNIWNTGSNALSTFSGYAVNFGTSNSPQTIALNGTVGNGTQSLTLYSHNQPYTAGFNLVGNPYPSPIDWKSASGWTKTNIDDALYFFNNGTTDQYAGTYSTYVNGVSSIGAISNRNIIPAMQGFFVHVTNGSYPVTATLTATNAVRSKLLTTAPAIAFAHKGQSQLELGPGVSSSAGSGSTFSSGSKPLARLSASFSSSLASDYDPMVVYFDSKQNQKFDQAFDALKLMNTDSGVPSLYILSADQQRLSILALPVSDLVQKTIPLGLKLDRDGQMEFLLSDLISVPFAHVYFHDAGTGSFTELKLASPVSIRLSKGVYENRFQLVFSNTALNALPASNPSLNLYSSSGSVYLTMDTFTGDKGDAVIYNMLGQQVYRQNVDGAGKHIFDPHLENGIYIMQVNSTTGLHTRNLLLAH